MSALVTPETSAPREALRATARRRALVTTLVVAAVLALGYLDLARGGITWSAILLLLGYVVGVPAAIVALTAPALRRRPAARR